MAYEWLSPALSFIGGLAGSVVTLKIGLSNFKLSKQSLKQQRIINKMNLKNAQKINEQNLKADVVVKSRMKWIEEVRHLSSNLIKTYTDMYSTNENANVALQSANKLMESNKYLINQHKTETDENKKSDLIKKSDLTMKN